MFTDASQRHANDDLIVMTKMKSAGFTVVIGAALLCYTFAHTHTHTLIHDSCCYVNKIRKEGVTFPELFPDPHDMHVNIT